jgi:DNA repair exonuclease SbcCD nuclease subunit
VDAVVHGGDLFYRSRIPPSLVQRAFQPIARLGVPVLIVPGNHERSAIPYPLLALHKNVFIFDRPRTFVVGGVAFSGFPFAPHVRQRFGMLLAEARAPPAPVRILCMHQAVEGARVGTPEFVFDRGDDVIRGGDIPPGFAAVFSGHIHRGQRLGRWATPVFYPGSIERTSWAERLETKGYLIVRVAPGPPGGRVESFSWNPLPTVPPSPRRPAPRFAR